MYTYTQYRLCRVPLDNKLMFRKHILDQGLLIHLFAGPGDIKPKSEVKIRVPKEESKYSIKVKNTTDPKAIWDIDEVHTVPFCDDASYDPRQRPEFDVKYRQAITSEDVFLQVGAVNST